MPTPTTGSYAAHGTSRFVPPVVLESDELKTLRHEVRGFVAEQRRAGRFEPTVDAWLTGWDRDFTRALGERGLLGMVVPTEYGGQGRSALEAFVVAEELVVAGAPVAAHWVAERQVAPALVRWGTEAQKSSLLPRISRGELVLALGMSEPESGHDLVRVRTRASRVAGGWRLSGTKTWTAGSHQADAIVVLARTAPVSPEGRRDGLTQFLVDLHAPGIEIRPIISMDGSHQFDEVHLDRVTVTDDAVLGRPGDGWSQVQVALASDRSGPERVLSAFPLLAEAASAMDEGELPTGSGLGRHIARVSAVHHMSLAVAAAAHDGARHRDAAAIIKLLGTLEEGEMVDHVDSLTATGWVDDSDLYRLLHAAIAQRPGFTLRGGTSEILRGVIAESVGVH